MPLILLYCVIFCYPSHVRTTDNISIQMTLPDFCFICVHDNSYYYK